MVNENSLIDVNDALKVLCGHCGIDFNECKRIGYCAEYMDIKRIPTVDAVPVVHGRWIDGFFKNTVECSVCLENGICKCYETKHNCCPNCGANMMDGGNEDE